MGGGYFIGVVTREVGNSQELVTLAKWSLVGVDTHGRSSLYRNGH